MIVRSSAAGLCLLGHETGRLGGEPFGDESPVLFVALGAVVLAQIMVAAVDPDDGQILGLEVAVLGDAGSLGGHRAVPRDPGVVPVLLFESLQAALPTIGR